MEDINRIELQGRVGNLRTNTVNGTMVANFSLATDLRYKNSEGAGVSETTWHNVVAWSGRDMPDLSKITIGMPLYVSGRMRTTKYTTAEGTDKYFYEVLANRIRFVTEDNVNRE